MDEFDRPVVVVAGVGGGGGVGVVAGWAGPPASQIEHIFTLHKPLIRVISSRHASATHPYLSD